MTLTKIPEMWELMERSFSGDDPPFDLVGCDDLLLVEAARAGHVASLDEFVAARRRTRSTTSPRRRSAP